MSLIKLNKTERKKIFFKILSPYFTNLGYKQYLSGSDPLFALNKNQIVIHFGFNFFSNDTIGCSPVFITHYEVENYILDIGIPTNELEEQKKKDKYHLPTIELRAIPEDVKPRRLTTSEEIEIVAKSFIFFHESKIIEFVEIYSCLPAILKEMDRLRSENKYWNGILSGGPEHLIKGLIISKLCGDIGYEEKYHWVEELFKDLDEWTIYWEKYKEVLKDIVPKYNLA